MVGQRRIQIVQIQLGAVPKKQIHQRSRHVRVARLLARRHEPHRCPAVPPERRRVHVGAALDQQPGDVEDVRGEGSAIWISRDVMEERRASEVAVSRIEIRPRVNQRGLGFKEVA